MKLPSGKLAKTLYKLIDFLSTNSLVYKVYEGRLRRQISNGNLPEHIGIILDGNRRWARERGLPPWAGHEIGADRVEEVLEWCWELGIKAVTLYVFSTENFQRSREEVEKIMEIVENKLRKMLQSDRVHEVRVRVKAIGRLEFLPESVREVLRELEEATKDYDSHYLNIAIAYGGRAEIVDAVRKIVEKARAGEIAPEDVDEGVIEEYLYTSHLPKPELDLVIRTSGEERLSNFLLWQCAYSELVFLDVYWPDFRKIDLWRAIRTYQQRVRRFGA